jgi:sn-1 stearoyl-lipid 9-desaturase
LYVRFVKTYNAVGCATLAFHALVSALLAPQWLGPWRGLAVGFAYLAISWFVCGLYLSDVIHMGIAHRALDYKEWFIKAVTLLNNALGIYVNPVTWVNRHRLHHRFADHPGDPNKRDSDGFWRTLYLCVLPYPCTADLATDAILKTWPFRLVSHPLFALVSPVLSCGLLWWLVRDWRFAIGVWLGVRVFALWVNMIQNYWTHDRRFGVRRYDDPNDNAMNIGDWFPVTATFSACWQNNHHHHPRFLRLTHDPAEYDFGLMTVKVMSALGLVQPSESGRIKPESVALAEIGL